MTSSSRIAFLGSFISLGLLAGCAEFNDPYYSSPRSGYGGGYNDPYYRDRDDDYNRRRRWEEERRERREDQRELDRERERLEAERRRLEAEREASHRAPPRHEEHCPPGFSPSEQKCSSQERRRGCQDMRLPGGLGCVKR